MEIPLTLSPRPSILDGLQLLEPYNPAIVKALCVSNCLRDTNKVICRDFANEKEQLQQYLCKYDRALGGTVVSYSKAKHKVGRTYPKRSLGLTAFRRRTRNTILAGNWHDFDIVNAQPSILVSLCKANDIRCQTIEDYCHQRDHHIAAVAAEYNVSEKLAKDLFIRLCFGGTFDGWLKENNLSGGNREPTQFIKWFASELNSIATLVKGKNPQLYETARKLKAETTETKEARVMASFFALYCQEHEARIIETIIAYLFQHTTLFGSGNLKTGTYEYDGIKLLKTNVDNNGGADAVVSLLNQKTKELTGFDLTWKLKPIDSQHNVDDLVEQIMDSSKPDAELQKVKEEIDGYDGDVGVIECIMKILPSNFVYSVSKEDGSNGVWYGWNGTRWERSCSPLRMAIMYKIPAYLDKLLEPFSHYDELTTDEKQDNDNYETYTRVLKKVQEMKAHLRKANDVNNAVTIAKDMLRDWTLQFDNNRDLFGCENGVIDLAQRVFRPYKFDDYMTMSCGYHFKPLTAAINVQKTADAELSAVDFADFTPADEEAFKNLYDVLTKIFPDEALRNYWLKIISTGISGMAIEQFFIFNGKGRNGKGVSNEFLKDVLGDYFGSADSTILTDTKRQKSSGSASPEIVALNKKRYVVIKEPSKSLPLSNSMIKEITGGGELNARALYSNKSEVQLHLTLGMECNVKPGMAEDPTEADIRRIVDLPFDSTFTDDKELLDDEKAIFLIDPTLKTTEWKHKHRNVMLNILVQHFLEVKDNNYNLNAWRPQCIVDRSMEYVQKSYDIHNIFLELFEQRDESKAHLYCNWKGELNDADWTLDKVQAVIRNSASFKSLPKYKQKEYTKAKVEEFFTTNKWYSNHIKKNTDRHCYLVVGWRKQITEEESD